ncbi:MAG: DUF1836 domain-containing protein [Lachnospirales bacterium]
MALAQQVNNIYPLKNFNNIKDNIQISKVVQYFENCGYSVPKTTIQNYSRTKTISELFQKRYYSKQNILEIYFTINFKDFFTLDEIKKINEHIFEMPYTSQEIYNIFIDIYTNFNIISYDEDIVNENLDFFYNLVSMYLSKKKTLVSLNNKN